MIDLIFLMSFFALGLTVSLYDIRSRIAPDALTLPLLLLGLLRSLYCPVLNTEQAIYGSILAYTLLSVLASLYFAWRHQVGLGQGDIKLTMGLGAWLGPYALLKSLCLASSLGALWTLLFVKDYKAYPVPLAPFLMLSSGLILICEMMHAC